MTDEKVARLNEFTRLAGQRELTAGESAERQALREEYLAEWRAAAAAALDNTYLVDDRGEKKKLPKKK